MSNTCISVPKYDTSLLPVKRTCTTVRLTERQFHSLPKLKSATGSPSLASTVLLCLHQMYSDIQDKLHLADDYTPNTAPNPFTFNFNVSADDRNIIDELKGFFGMRTNSQLIGYILDRYTDALENGKDGE